MKIIKENSKLMILGLLIAGGLALMGMTNTPKYHYEIKHVTLGDQTNFYFFRIKEQTGEIERYAWDGPNAKTAQWYSILEKRETYIHSVSSPYQK
jgi:hypothetical protein